VGVSGSYNGGGAENNQLPAPTVSPPIGPGEPSFDLSTPKNVTALVGKSAYLSCRVRNLGNKTVSYLQNLLGKHSESPERPGERPGGNLPMRTAMYGMHALGYLLLSYVSQVPGTDVPS